MNRLINWIRKHIRRWYRRKPKLVRVRRVWHGAPFPTWYWHCMKCDHNLNPHEYGSTHYGELCPTWEQANRRADHHARAHRTA